MCPLRFHKVWCVRLKKPRVEDRYHSNNGQIKYIIFPRNAEMLTKDSQDVIQMVKPGGMGRDVRTVQ